MVGNESVGFAQVTFSNKQFTLFPPYGLDTWCCKQLSSFKITGSPSEDDEDFIQEMFCNKDDDETFEDFN